MPALIETERLARHFPAGEEVVRALSDVTVSIAPGEFVAAMGPSGSGKSTFLNLVGCLDRPTAGRYRLMGEEVEGLSHDRLAELRSRRIGFVFQSFNLLPRADALANVELPLVYRGLRRRARRDRAAMALAAVGLADRMRHRPSQLSGGQQQRVAIARAIVGRPRILLADEPTGNLDSQMGDEIMGLVEALNRDDRSTVVMVTHDARLAQRAHRTIRLFDGRQVQ